MRDPERRAEAPRRAAERFTAWLESDRFTCLGALAALHRGELVVRDYGRLTGETEVRALHADLTAFVERRLAPGTDPGFHSFAALFAASTVRDEAEFERVLWGLLQALHERDRTRHEYAPDVSSDPGSPSFGFSVAGHPFFVVGLHPGATRISRRSPIPTVVFNSHRQFARLKESGVYQGLRTRIRAREVRLQGSVNPMLAEHGERSEAPQYSGRFQSPHWSCPFRPHAED
ncbi:guanitoxin biosynthesis heme-dependent pre-guanitoxin N-hydroxylase GntA [Streptomyces zagrosensis]|uniref:YqcI/YcgG family protein n=1 Tax=Streptomyces zagrosensis TaxID=1042984 RepID=A0A7W9QFX6_9ACTN|nr:guanitoxin biosynthesis heme-dependent pre-guanitoxin N-hydroxylase GntA [Streptomyces zagrosensis]MBB5938983.1 hypothetical protein [Streptomyces zagrosensis]